MTACAARTRLPCRSALRLLYALPLLLASCADKSPTPADLTLPGGRSPELNVGADGRVYLSWQETRDGASSLRYTSFDGRSWSKPGTIAEGTDWFVNAADFPSVTAFGDGLLAAHWLQKNGPDVYAYEIRMRLSRDGGQTWDAPFTLHDDATQSEHGFVTLLPDGSGRLHAIWLDGRHAMSGTVAGHETHGAMSLRHAVLDANGTILSQDEVDARTCDCCQTSAIETAAGLLVAYRDRTESEVRDVVVRRRESGTWSEPVSLDRDPWTIDACPVNGPSLAQHAQTTATAWFSGAENTPRVLAATSTDGGRSFAEPVRVDHGRPAGRVDVAVLDDGTLLVSWLELQDDGATLNLRRVLAEGKPGETQTLARLGAAAANTFPRMVRSGPHVIVAWTERTADDSLVRATVLDAGEAGSP